MLISQWIRFTDLQAAPRPVPAAGTRTALRDCKPRLRLLPADDLRLGSQYTQASRSSLDASHQALRRDAVKEELRRGIRQYFCLIASLLSAGATCRAQQTPKGRRPLPRPRSRPSLLGHSTLAPVKESPFLRGTRVGVVLQNGISHAQRQAGRLGLPSNVFSDHPEQSRCDPGRFPIFAVSCWNRSGPGASRAAVSSGCVWTR